MYVCQGDGGIDTCMGNHPGSLKTPVLMPVIPERGREILWFQCPGDLLFRCKIRCATNFYFNNNLKPETENHFLFQVFAAK